MPIALTRALPIIVLVILLVGCGSSSYPNDARTGIAKISSVIKTFDSSRPADVAATGLACARAARDLRKDSGFTRESAPSHYAALESALAGAFSSLLAGFDDCARGAAQSDYARMATADSELAGANVWIDRAKALDR